MKIGYPCVNLTLSCRSSHTFRLKHFSEGKLLEIISQNLDCLEQILQYNKENSIYLFRITSGLIPFASHPIMNVKWQQRYKSKFLSIGEFIKSNDMRITMHPGQYIVLNSKNPEVYSKCIEELIYHVEILDLLGLDSSAKVEIHVGGVYGNKEQSLIRFIERYKMLNVKIKKRLIIENDDKSYNLSDCLKIHSITKIPIVFDVFHDECLKSKGSIEEKLEKVKLTWKEQDGLPIIHYSSLNPAKGKRSHAESINLSHFRDFLKRSKDFDFDIMLEIKDKDKSALRAIPVVSNDPRFIL